MGAAGSGQRELWRLSACEAVELLRTGQVTPLQLVEVAEQRWKETEPHINAMPITCWERARARARALMQAGWPAEQQGRGYLYGLPIAVKDTMPVAGVRWTQGSVLFRDRVATTTEPMVELLEAKGAIVVGKTNTPEFAAGSQTYNELFGVTRNPWDTSKTVGGSSGGSAAALAAGQVWLATGSDLGGSLRNPASFCGVVGMRGSTGVVPQLQYAPESVGDRSRHEWRLMAASGMLARSVDDLALALDAVADRHPDDPLSLPPPERPFSAAVADGLGGVRRLVFSPDLGHPPVCREVVAVCRAALAWWSAQGVEVAPDGCPALQDAMRDMPRLFEVLRAKWFEFGCSGIRLESPEAKCLKPELVWQLERARDLTQQELDWAIAAHDGALVSRDALFRDFQLLACPTVMLPPFDASIHWPREFEGHEFKDYLTWLKSASLLSALDVPTISVPCGFTASGLPVGLQLAGPPGADAAVLAAAAAFQRGNPQHQPEMPLAAVRVRH